MRTAEKVYEGSSFVGESIIFGRKKLVSLDVVDFNEVYVDAISKISIYFLNVETMATVIYLVNVSGFLSEHIDESEDF